MSTPEQRKIKRLERDGVGLLVNPDPFDRWWDSPPAAFSRYSPCGWRGLLQGWSHLTAVPAPPRTD